MNRFVLWLLFKSNQSSPCLALLLVARMDCVCRSTLIHPSASCLITSHAPISHFKWVAVVEKPTFQWNTLPLIAEFILSSFLYDCLHFLRVFFFLLFQPLDFNKRPSRRTKSSYESKHYVLILHLVWLTQLSILN